MPDETQLSILLTFFSFIYLCVSLLLFPVLCGSIHIKFAFSFSESYFYGVYWIEIWWVHSGTVDVAVALRLCLWRLSSPASSCSASTTGSQTQETSSCRFDTLCLDVVCGKWWSVWLLTVILLRVVLQSKILEMESRMRQLAADRDREQQSKLKAEEETRRQTEQLDLMEEAHQRQQEEALNTWKREKVWKHSSCTHSQQFRWKFRDSNSAVPTVFKVNK